MYIRDRLPYHQRFDIMDNRHGVECCWAEITRPKTRKLIICSVYRAPNLPIRTLVESFDAALPKIPENVELVVLGDFNVDFISRSSSRTNLKRLMNLHNLTQLVKNPTRVTVEKESTIDLIFVNNKYRIVNNGVLSMSLSDHSLVYCIIKAGLPKAPSRVIEYRSYKLYDKNFFARSKKCRLSARI